MHQFSIQTEIQIFMTGKYKRKWENRDKLEKGKASKFALQGEVYIYILDDATYYYGDDKGKDGEGEGGSRGGGK